MARILVVDDAAFMRMMVRDMLKKIEHQVAGDSYGLHQSWGEGFYS